VTRLVLLPGMDGTGELFRDFVAALPEGAETVVAHYPGDRRLRYPALMEFVLAAVSAISATSPNQPFFLVAESFSTPLAIQYAATNPPNLKGLVLCAGFCTSPLQGWRRTLAFGLAQFIFWLPLPGFGVEMFLAGPNAPRALVAAVKAAASWVEPEIMAGRVRDVLTCDVRAALAKISVPILYLQAAQDQLVSPACLAEAQRIKPEETVVVDGPHLLMQREPKLCADVVMRFVQGDRMNAAVQGSSIA
jgi:pimeloyl-[acyl-carrier protein] methyl ester esterase